MPRGANAKADQTVIAAGVQVKGNLKCAGDLWFDGLIAGDIEAGGNVQIGPNAAVTGNAAGANLNLAGRIQGNVMVAGTLTLAPTGVILGDIKTKQLEVAAGATVSGHLQMEQAEEIPAAST